MKTLQSPYIVIPFWGAVAGAMLAGTGPFWLAAVGLATWPLVEYSAHRWGMHALERRWPRFYKRAHGVHHRYPGDLSHFPEARDTYDRARADGAEVAVHGAAPWAVEADVVDVGTAAFLGLYADRVVGGGLPALLGR